MLDTANIHMTFAGVSFCTSSHYVTNGLFKILNRELIDKMIDIRTVQCTLATWFTSCFIVAIPEVVTYMYMGAGDSPPPPVGSLLLPLLPS